MMRIGENQTYNIGIYARESRDENEKNIETIETQRDLLIEFAKRSKLGNVHRIYMDNNVSGSGFRRKGLEGLKRDVKTGEINLLLLKDLSRLGRNNAQTLLFLDFLEEHGVRVLTSDGRYDSIKDNDTVGIETWVNERYVRDISRKIRANLRFKIEKGEYIGRAPYGYVKSGNKKNTLEIHPQEAEVVREIYKLYLEGYGYSAICKKIQQKDYPPPSSKYYKGSSNDWNVVAVQRILSNRVYIGDTVQGVSEKVSFKSKKTRRLPENQWVVTQKTHEPIVELRQFNEVQKLRHTKKKGGNNHKGRIHPLKGLMYCGGCGSKMFARSRKKRPMSYLCSNYFKNGRKACTSHHVKEETVLEVLKDELLRLLRDKELMENVKSLMETKIKNSRKDFKEPEEIEQQLIAKQRQQETLYMDRLNGKISEGLFLRMNFQMEKKISILQNEVTKYHTQQKSTSDIDKLTKEFGKFIGDRGITNRIATSLANKITVFDQDDFWAKGTISALVKENDKLMEYSKIIIVDFNSNYE